MKSCMQTAGQNTLQHGLSVWKHVNKLRNGDIENFKIPSWYSNYKDQVLANLHPFKIHKHYCIFHDAGKFKCLTIDADGKRHYPNHAEESEKLWNEIFPNRFLIGRLIGLDMICHTESYEQIKARNLSTKDICTLLITALAEIHANAQFFGGIESDSFKIKFKRLEKLGNKLCKDLFDHGYVYVIVRNDLSPAQRAVQSGHVLIEMARNFIKINDVHPSVIICIVKDENKLKSTIKELYDKNIKISTFREPDKNNEITAVATEPLYGESRNHLSRFQLLI